jgi:aarF domain-containing kinase
MKNAHVESLQLLATPFREDTQQPFAFGPGSTWASITAEIRERIPTMLHHRLTPPPRETYSLNRCAVPKQSFPEWCLTFCETTES